MNQNKYHSFDLTIIASLQNLVSISHESITDVLLTYDLSPDALLKLRAADMCNIQINRLCKIFEYLSRQKTELQADAFESFDPFYLLSEITQNFSKTVSRYLSVNIDCYSKMENPFPIAVNKTKFELMLLSLLYCCLRSVTPDYDKNLKLTLYLTETKTSLVFHLRDNCSHINPNIIENVFSNSRNILEHTNLTEALISLSLEAASKAATESNGILSYKALKGGNRYDITFPKEFTLRKNVAKSPSRYIPTYSLFEEIFADIFLEYQLSQISKDKKQ